MSQSCCHVPPVINYTRKPLKHQKWPSSDLLTEIWSIKLIPFWGLVIYFSFKLLSGDKEFWNSWLSSKPNKQHLLLQAINNLSVAKQPQFFSYVSAFQNKTECLSNHWDGCKPLQGKETMESISHWWRYVSTGHRDLAVGARFSSMWEENVVSQKIKSPVKWNVCT